jgi:Co/Zn/Cd efflux system component
VASFLQLTWFDLHGSMVIGVLVFVQNKFLSEIENLLMLESAAEQKETKVEEVVQMCCKALMCST